MKRALICNIIPNKLVHLLHSPQAVNNFCFNLIDNKCFEEVYSIIPISYNDERIKSDDNVKYFTQKKHSNKYVAVLFLLLSNLSCSLQARKADTIWFYNIVKSNIISYLILRYIFKKKVYVILLDYTPCNNKFSLQNYIPFLIKKSFGLISLSSRTEITHPNMDYIAGIIPIDKIMKKTSNPNDKLRFLFSGILGRHTGFDLAIDVFEKLPDCELYVTGFGELDSVNFNKYINIKYLGYLSYEEYLKLYNEVDICLSFRDPKFPENINNFPSKILEYFSFNKIVISTISYPELKDFKYFSCDYKIENVTKIIEHVCRLQKNKLISYFDNSEALKNNFSEIKWRNTLNRIERRI